LVSGRFLNGGDMYSVVIGEKTCTPTFDKDIPLNTKIIINGVSFNVIGILENSNSIYIPLQVARDVLDDVGDKELDSISVKIADVTLADETVSNITKKLMTSRGILKEEDLDFSVSNPSTMQETMKETMQTMALFLGSIAAISLLVGAIGIANSHVHFSIRKDKRYRDNASNRGSKQAYITNLFI
jgi:putative ABC transport system permease protein